ncbi:hypothetical protein DINM_001673 [Dirofilaria immitis]|nr:hypothetical protein [Dirofilaria immitis]
MNFDNTASGQSAALAPKGSGVRFPMFPIEAVIRRDRLDPPSRLSYVVVIKLVLLISIEIICLMLSLPSLMYYQIYRSKGLITQNPSPSQRSVLRSQKSSPLFGAHKHGYEYEWIYKYLDIQI